MYLDKAIVHGGELIDEFQTNQGDSEGVSGQFRRAGGLPTGGHIM